MEVLVVLAAEGLDWLGDAGAREEDQGGFVGQWERWEGRWGVGMGGRGVVQIGEGRGRGGRGGGVSRASGDDVVLDIIDGMLWTFGKC